VTELTEPHPRIKVIKVRTVDNSCAESSLSSYVFLRNEQKRQKEQKGPLNQGETSRKGGEKRLKSDENRQKRDEKSRNDEKR